MTRRRFIADEVSGDRAVLTGAHADHLARVLRARVGQDFDIATDRAVRRGRITDVGEGRVVFELGEAVPAADLPEITLLLAIFKFDRMEWAIEKCTELGVSRIVPVIARRTDSHLAAASLKRADRWQRIVRQASEQSRRAAPPEVAPPTKLSDLADRSDALRIVLAESERQTLLHDVLNTEAAYQRVILAIGPEGGWTEGELKFFQDAGWVSVSLGSTILRAETAAIAATAVVASFLTALNRDLA